MASQTLQGGAEDTGAADDGDAVGTIQGDDCAICLEPLGSNDKDDDVTLLKNYVEGNDEDEEAE